MSKGNGTMEIERNRPFGPLASGKTLVLPVERINPVIRIAHRLKAPLQIPERIIFDHELVLIVDGVGVLRYRDGEVSFDAGTLLFIPPFWPHAFESKGRRGEHLAVHFDFRSNLPPRGNDPSRRKPYRVRLSEGLQLPQAIRCTAHDEIHRSFVALVDAQARSGPVAGLDQRGHLLRIIAKLLRTSGESNESVQADQRNIARLDRAVRHMVSELNKPLDVDALATIAGLSPSHFTRLFREHTGYTPMQYLRKQRIDLARQLLADVDLSVKEIAIRCGFDDPYHFSKVFHQIDGLPPTAYREALLAGRR